MTDAGGAGGTAVSRLAAVLERISGAAARAGRPAGCARLVVVGKTFPPEDLADVVAAGQVRLGENRVQEAEAKAPHLPATVEWHLVGHLQGNKAARAARIFHWIHSLDSERLGRRLSAAAAAAGRRITLLAQVDFSGAPGRSGVAPEGVADLAASVRGLRAVRLSGLMTVPPQTPTAEGARPFYRRLRELAERLAGQGLLPTPFELSMGMSGDFEVAVEEGATLVRVGTAVLGERPPLRS